MSFASLVLGVLIAAHIIALFCIVGVLAEIRDQLRRK